jgi:ectoine hydroxylase-related dioxygenase (phytanoyl-CoA dioxygenase family)
VFASPFDCVDVFLHPTLVEFYTRTLGPKFVFEAIGVLSSLPGAEDQHLHSDGSELFNEVGIDRLLPNVALTVVIPLVRMDAVSGMTAFWPGSHLHRDDVDRTQFVAPELDPGSCAIWDFRLRHRGLANKGDRARLSLYLTVCRPFWIDHQNFEPGVNAKLLASRAALDRLSEQDRKRFARARLVE